MYIESNLNFRKKLYVFSLMVVVDANCYDILEKHERSRLTLPITLRRPTNVPPTATNSQSPLTEAQL